MILLEVICWHHIESIQPSSSTYPCQGREGLEPLPATIGQEASYRVKSRKHWSFKKFNLLHPWNYLYISVLHFFKKLFCLRRAPIIATVNYNKTTSTTDCGYPLWAVIMRVAAPVMFKADLLFSHAILFGENLGPVQLQHTQNTLTLRHRRIWWIRIK